MESVPKLITSVAIFFLVFFTGSSQQDTLLKKSYGNSKTIQSIQHLTTSPCGESQTFCEEVPGYPAAYIRQAMKINGLVKYFPQYDDYEVQYKRGHHYFTHDLKICKTYRATYRPQSAENKNGDWMYVINQGKFVQEITLELCEDIENTPCNFVHLPFGYRSECKQIYDYRRLYAINRTGDILLDEFKFPSHCACEIIYDGMLSE